jgi:hypothetical protein
LEGEVACGRLLELAEAELPDGLDEIELLDGLEEAEPLIEVEDELLGLADVELPDRLVVELVLD